MSIAIKQALQLIIYFPLFIIFTVFYKRFLKNYLKDQSDCDDGSSNENNSKKSTIVNNQDTSTTTPTTTNKNTKIKRNVISFDCSKDTFTIGGPLCNLKQESIERFLNNSKQLCSNRYAKVRFSFNKPTRVLIVNEVEKMKALLLLKCEFKFDSQLVQPFLVLDSTYENKLNTYEYETLFMPYYKRLYETTRRHFIDSIVKRNFLDFLQDKHDTLSVFQKRLNNVISASCYDYLVFVYASECSSSVIKQQECLELFNKIENISKHLHQMHTLSLFLKEKNDKTETYRELYAKFLDSIELIFKTIHKTANKNMNKNNLILNLLFTRHLFLNIWLIQSYIEYIINEYITMKNVELKSSIQEELREYGNSTNGFIELDSLWRYKSIKKLLRMCLCKSMAIDIYKLSANTRQAGFDKNELILLNLFALNDDERETLEEYLLNGSDNFVSTVLLSLIVNILQSYEFTQKNDAAEISTNVPNEHTKNCIKFDLPVIRVSGYSNREAYITKKQ